MEKRKYIVLLAAMLLVIGAPSLLFAGGGETPRDRRILQDRATELSVECRF
jgi:hypothetical protein